MKGEKSCQNAHTHWGFLILTPHIYKNIFFGIVAECMDAALTCTWACTIYVYLQTVTSAQLVGETF